MIWGRSGNKCAFPDCRKTLVVHETSTDDASIIGEEAHIVAQKEDGPRGQSPLTPEQRDKYDNLILLCSSDHKIIDDQVNKYTVEVLKQLKLDHENWIKSSLSYGLKKVKDDELYASYIEKFIEMTDLHNWINWTSWILGASEIFPKKQFDSLKLLPDYIVSRIWPGRYPMLEASLINFKNVLNDLIRVYYEYPKIRSDGYAIEKFYKDFDHNDHWEGVKLYQYHVALIEDLVLELTRAANYVCDQVRFFLFEGFRLEEGVLLIMRGDFMQSNTYRVEYREQQRTELPYIGLRWFMTERESRDLHVGEGIEETYFPKQPWQQ